MMRVFRALSIAAAYLALLVLGMPGLDFLPPSYLKAEHARERMSIRHGPFLTELAVLAGDLNRVRLNAEKTLGKIQPVFRIAQSWHLFRDGPGPIRRLEIQVDRVPVYRTLDPDLDWMEPVLRSRRIRPVVESMVSKPRAVNRWGLARLIVERARRDFPRVQRVEITALSGPRPGHDLERRHRLVAEAPEWTVVEAR